MIFDLHNDFPTALPSYEFARYIERAAATVTAAIWTSELSDPRGFIETIMPTLENSGMPIALEDIGFLCGSDIEEFDFSRFCIVRSLGTIKTVSQAERRTTAV